MFCKYCGTEIADDSVFCAKCGKKIQEVASNNHNEKSDDCNSTCVQFVANEKDIWEKADNLRWVKPIGARIMQTILLIIGLFFLCYGVVWYCIIEKKVSDDSHPCFYPSFYMFTASACEPMGIIDVWVDLERDDPDFSLYKSEWETIYSEKYYLTDKVRISNDKVTKRLCKEWGIDTTLTYNDMFKYDVYHNLTSNQRSQLRSEIDRETPARDYIPYEYAQYYTKVEQMAVSLFRTHTLFFFILPALVIIILSTIWIVKITPKSGNKLTLPRDYADKIESYTWNGFSLHKYIRFIKDEKYGILDAANRSITVPATFELIKWREKNKSYDGVLDGVRKTYNLCK